MDIANLSIAFADVQLPTTVDFGAAGQATIELTNTGTTAIDGVLNLYISTDDNFDVNNDGILGTQAINIAPGATATVAIPYENISSVVAPGAYNLLAEVVSGEESELVSEFVSAPGSNVVTTWHAVALNATQEFGEITDGIPPTLGSRAFAIVQASVFNAVNAFGTQEYNFYAVDPGTPSLGASQEAAAAGAAFTALNATFPAEVSGRFQEQLDRTVAELLAAGQSQASIDAGLAFGVVAAQQLVGLRADDNAIALNGAEYVPAGNFEQYVWQSEGFALGPEYGLLQPFTLAVNPAEFLSTVPDIFDGDLDNNIGETIDGNEDGALLDGRPFAVPFANNLDGRIIDAEVDEFQQDLYATEIEEVRLFGGLQDTATTTLQRTQDQTELAIFWAYDRPDSFRPPGQLQQIAQESVFRSGQNLVDSARTLALLSLTLADVPILAWYAKYTEVQPRPDDVISGDGQGTPITELDGIDETIADTDFQPLLPTPPFPDFLSGHSTFGGAFGAVLDFLFPGVESVSAVSQEIVPGTDLVAPGDPSLFNVDTFNPVRTFTPVEIEGQSYGAYTAAGFEDALSRVFGGVHVREATTDAAATGFALGNFVANNFLQPFSGLIFGSDGDDTLEAGLDGFDGTDDLIFGGAGDDLVDTSTSGDGGNTVFGGSGLDELLSGRADRIFGGSGNDTLDGNGASDGRLYGGDGNDDLFAGTGDRLFGGAGDDTLNAVAGGGSNRLYGGDGNDDLFAGTGDRLIGGAGDDGLFAVGSNSVLTGGDGADIFWVVNGELPSTANTVTDFEAGVDTVGVGGLGVSFADLTISQSGSDTTVALLGQTVAIFLGTQPSELSASSFVFA